MEREVPRNPNQPESGPVVGVALDVAASQNWLMIASVLWRSSSDLQFERISSRLSVVIIKASL